MKTKAIPEKIYPNYGSSIRVRKFHAQKRDGAPFWHFHPELQLVYVNRGSGKRHIGHHLSYFRHGDLVLIGSNLPHYGITDQLVEDMEEIIVQFRSDFLGSQLLEVPEWQMIRQLFERAKYGIHFHRSVKDLLGERLKSLYEMDSFDRLMAFVDILQFLAETPQYSLLNVQEYALEVNQQENERMRSIYSYVRQNFRESIPLQEIADQSNMTVPSFCRYFKKQSGKTFTQFVNEFRIIHSCKLLSETSHTVSAIAMESGFNNFSHFNRLFKQINKKSPGAYRKDFKDIRM